MASIATVAAVAGVVSAGVGAYSTIQAGEAQSKEAAYQAAVARNNATIAEQNAEYATKAGQEKAAEESLANANKEGAIRAAIAANGIDTNSGSAEDIQKSQREVDKLDLLTTLNNAALTAYGYRSQETGFNAQAGLDSAQSRQAQIAGDIGAVGSIAGNASNLAFKWGGLNTGSDPTQNIGFNTPNAQTQVYADNPYLD